VFVWNGAKFGWAEMAKRCRAERTPTLIMERGIFARMRYTQIDHVGFNHTASWAGRVDGTAPPEGPSRQMETFGPCKSLAKRHSGYLLVLLQMPGDAQLADSELHHPGPFVEAVQDAAPPDLDIRVRAHPHCPWSCGTSGRARMIDGDLADAIAGARFCLTINSNAGNEALGMGCPVLCLGPALYSLAGVAMPTSLANLAVGIRWMLDVPGQNAGRTTAYLEWLACRQWSNAELAQGDVLRGLIDAAM
jgi:hypothetical protein